MFLHRGICLSLLVFALGARCFAGAVIREEGAIYFEDFSIKPIKTAVLTNTSIYYDARLERYLGTLRKGDLVEVQAVSDVAYRVRGNAQQGQVIGWVETKFLTQLKKDFVENLKKNADRFKQVQSLITKNEVAVNMTPEEVIASLGKPQKKTSRLDASGREDVWQYVRYEIIPKETTGYDNAGRLVTQVVNVKVPNGKLAVVFDNNLVSSLEQTEGNLEHSGKVRIVVPPLTIAY